MSYSIEVEGIRRAVSVPQALATVGTRTRSRKRADCPLCKGKSRLTLAYTDSLWHCHRCGKGGDIFNLVQAIENCGFKDAFQILARRAGVTPGKMNTKAVQVRKKKRERAESAAAKLDAMERGLRLEYRDALHQLAKTQRTTSEALAQLINIQGFDSPGEETLWEKVQATAMLRSRVNAAYHLLAFGRLADRAHFVMRPRDRELVITQVLDCGFIKTDDGKTLEVTL
jgi:hypothetical protein